jgi:DNA-binding NarL/FixJ family response regulator
MKVIGQAENGNQAVELAEKLNPDVIMMDMVMPELAGHQATAQIKARNPAAHVLILTSFGDDENLIEAINAGALGCLLKDSEPDELLDAIRNVNRGKMSISHSLIAKLLKQPPQEKQAASLLTDREEEIAALVAQGLSNKEIALELTLSTNTVRSHVSNILRKLKLSNRTQIAIYFKDGSNFGE